MTTKYIITVKKNNLMASNEKALKHYIMACGKIELEGNYIKYSNIECNFDITTFINNETDIIVYQIIIYNNSIEPDINSDITKTYASLQRILEKILYDVSVNFEVVWDELSYYCAQISYPSIYKIENTMRMLITKFMLVNVGANWSEKEVPSSIKKSPSSNRESNKLHLKQSIVYKLDFIELSDILFKAFPLKERLSDLQQVKDNITWDNVSPFVPMSNWERFFKDIVNIESEQLKKIWEELYQYRCSIAHNKRITLDDFHVIESKISKIAPALNAAINALNDIAVPKDDTEKIAETVVSMNDELLKRFLSIYEMFRTSTNEENYRQMGYYKVVELYHSKGEISEDEKNRLLEIGRMRNDIVHCVNEYNKKDIEEAIIFLNDLTARIW